MQLQSTQYVLTVYNMVTCTSANVVVTEVQAELPRNPVSPSGSEDIYQAVCPGSALLFQVSISVYFISNIKMVF